jgi:hypothetical protein
MRTITIVKYTFAIIGLFLLIGCIVFSITTKQFIDKAIVATGTVVSMEMSTSGSGPDTYRPVVTFQTVNSETIQFTSSSGSSPASYRVGQGVEVIYDPESPDNAKIKSFQSLWLGSMIFGVLGIMFSSFGFGMILHGKKRGNVIQRLKEFGLPIETQFHGVEENEKISVNRRHPYRIVSHWTKDNELHVFRSENLWFDPSDRIESDKITVWVDPNNMKKYYMDIAFLKQPSV